MEGSSPDGAAQGSVARSAGVLGSAADIRHVAQDLLRRGDDLVPLPKQVRIFDYPKFAEPFRDRLRENAERLVAGIGISIEFISVSHCSRHHSRSQFGVSARLGNIALRRGSGSGCEQSRYLVKEAV